MFKVSSSLREIKMIKDVAMFKVSSSLREIKMIKDSVSGNRTPVSRVTGGDTHHYTNTD